MNIFKVLFELFILYILYKVIFDFIIPLYRTTKQVKQKVADMQSKMNAQQNESQTPKNTSASNYTKPNKSDYIDFEEVKY